MELNQDLLKKKNTTKQLKTKDALDGNYLHYENQR